MFGLCILYNCNNVSVLHWIFIGITLTCDVGLCWEFALRCCAWCGMMLAYFVFVGRYGWCTFYVCLVDRFYGWSVSCGCLCLCRCFVGLIWVYLGDVLTLCFLVWAIARGFLLLLVILVVGFSSLALNFLCVRFNVDFDFSLWLVYSYWALSRAASVLLVAACCFYWCA